MTYTVYVTAIVTIRSAANASQILKISAVEMKRPKYTHHSVDCALSITGVMEKCTRAQTFEPATQNLSKHSLKSNK